METKEKIPTLSMNMYIRVNIDNAVSTPPAQICKFS